MMEQFDLFNVFNINVEEVEAKPRKAAGKNSKSSKETKNTKNTKNKVIETVYTLPLEVCMGVYEPFIYADAEGNAVAVTLTTIKDYICSLYSQYKPDVLSVKVENNKVFCGINPHSIVKKGNVTLTNESVAYLGSDTIDLSSIMTDESCDVDIEQISMLVSQMYPYIESVGVVYGSEKNILLIPCNHGELKNAFPITLNVFGREPIQVTQEKYMEYVDQDTSTDEDNDDENGDEEVEVDTLTLKKIVIEEYYDFDGHIQFEYASTGEILVLLKVIEESAKTGVAVKGSPQKEYPTNATISLYALHRIELSPDDFDGKTVVSEDEIIAFLSKLYPEYSKERTSLAYDKEHNLIMPILKGSTKGSFVVKTQEEYQERTNNGKYELFEYVADTTYRVESTPVSLTVASYEGGKDENFEMRIPHIPGQIRDCIRSLFKEVAHRYRTEFLVLVFYDIQRKGFKVFIPAQRNSSASVMAEYDNELMLHSYPIADIHSHCFYEPFFSSVDNNDELGNRIYGVFGAFDKGDGVDIYRAGTGGRFVDIQVEQIFTEEAALDDMKKIFVEKVLEMYEQGKSCVIPF